MFNTHSSFPVWRPWRKNDLHYFNISHFDSIVITSFQEMINITIVSYLLTHWVSTILVVVADFILEYCNVVSFALFHIDHSLAG